MTLQKHNSLYDYALMLSAILYTVQAGAFSPGATTHYSEHVSYNDTTLPYKPGLLEDPGHKRVAFKKVARPEVRINPAAAKFTEKFIKKNEQDLRVIQKRSGKFFDIIDPVFLKHDLPQQLKYLAVVESDLKADARSKVGAVGTWQLMKGTAQELGLTVKGKVDERKSISKSSVAAAKYLKSLHKYYGDWLLVIAAYNSGPGFVNAAIKKSGSRNFWKLQQYLPAETRGHVKRYIAIHYFFEGVGSETTLTKAENITYSKEMEQYRKTVERISLPVDTLAVQVLKADEKNSELGEK